MPALVKSASRRPRTNGGVLVIMYSLICDLCDIARGPLGARAWVPQWPFVEFRPLRVIAYRGVIFLQHCRIAKCTVEFGAIVL